jgi:glyoxylase-like metal-dependent hydrolase (beta-lactamase superfamily II)
MARKFAITLGAFIALAWVAFAQDAKTVVANTLKAMGGENMKSLQYTASGSGPGQLKDGNTPGPRSLIKSYVYTVDFTIPAARLETGVIGGLPPQTQLGGEGRAAQFVNGEYAWDIGGGVPGVIGGGLRPKDWPIIPFPASYTKAGDPMRQPNGDGLQSHSDVDRNEQIWLTPDGFLIGAMKNNATLAEQTDNGKKFRVVTWTGPNGQKINGYVGDDNMIAKVETWMDHPMYGDEHVVRAYDYYRDFGGGLQFPAHIVETINTPALTGDKSLNVELFVTEAKANVTADLSVPQGVRDTPPAPPFTIMTQKLGDGLWWLAGQNDCSLIVEFKDFVTVVEGPMNDDRSVAVIAETHKLIPNKPIRYMINTHAHVDHTGGVRGYAAIGATLITHQSNKEFIEALLKTPHTIIPDSLSKNPNAKWKVEGVDDSRVITDGSRRLEIYHVRGSLHTTGMLMTYLPKEKILTEGDPWTPGMVNPKPGDRAYQRCCDAQNLYDNVMRLHLDVKTFAPIHGRIDTWEHFVQYLGLPPESAAAKSAASGGN